MKIEINQGSRLQLDFPVTVNKEPVTEVQSATFSLLLDDQEVHSINASFISSTASVIIDGALDLTAPSYRFELWLVSAQGHSIFVRGGDLQVKPTKAGI